MDELTALYTHAPEIIPLAGIVLLAAGCLLAVLPGSSGRRPVKTWQVQEERYGLPDGTYCFCAYRRFGRYRVQVKSCPAYTAAVQHGLVTRNGSLELVKGFPTLQEAEKAAAQWAYHNQRHLVSGV